MSNMIFITSGLLTTIQDMGRVGYQQYGISAAGAMDQYALQLANILVDNERNEAGLEITIFGPEILFDFDGCIAITGGNLAPTINGYYVSMYKTLYVNKGDRLKFSHAKFGTRAYLAVQGGFNIDNVMGSKSTYLRGGFGGYKGRKIEVGDRIPVKYEKSFVDIGVRIIPESMRPIYKNECTIRAILGPEYERFTRKGARTFLKSKYTISNESDRMGYRLDGKSIGHKKGADITSGGITMGAIQVPGHGKPIIMMADRQTTGGYTKIANVITVDFTYLAQMKPGGIIKFQAVSIEEAHRLLKERENNIIELINGYKNKTIKNYKNTKYFAINVNNKPFSVAIREEK